MSLAHACMVQVEPKKYQYYQRSTACKQHFIDKRLSTLIHSTDLTVQVFLTDNPNGRDITHTQRKQIKSALARLGKSKIKLCRYMQ